MIKNQKLDHLGLYTKEIDKTVKWYCDVLGFSLIGDFVGDDGTVVKFIRNETGVCYELISPPDVYKRQRPVLIASWTIPKSCDVSLCKLRFTL